MMAFGHAASGVCAGFAVGDALQLPPLLTVLLGVEGAGAAIICDIDCKQSTASTAFGPISDLVHDGVVELHHMVCSAIDPYHAASHSEHRGLTHWWPWWVVTGGAVAIGCQMSRWVPLAVLSVLLVLAIRGLTIPGCPEVPQDRFRNPESHKRWMKRVYWALEHLPHMMLLRIARKYVTKTKRLGGKRIGVTIAIGKIGVIVTSFVIIFGADYIHQLPRLGPWLGLLVFAGQAIHWCGDLPTHMGVPGVLLTRVWKLPRRWSFYAGGPFEVFFLWIPLWTLTIYLIPGLRPHTEVMMALHWLGTGLAVLIVLFITVVVVKSRRAHYV
jgi:LexA-binding, inner membrane-associated putative hydrolase